MVSKEQRIKLLRKRLRQLEAQTDDDDDFDDDDDLDDDDDNDDNDDDEEMDFDEWSQQTEARIRNLEKRLRTGKPASQRQNANQDQKGQLKVKTRRTQKSQLANDKQQQNLRRRGRLQFG